MLHLCNVKNGKVVRLLLIGRLVNTCYTLGARAKFCQKKMVHLYTVKLGEFGFFFIFCFEISFRFLLKMRVYPRFNSQLAHRKAQTTLSEFLAR